MMDVFVQGKALAILSSLLTNLLDIVNHFGQDDVAGPVLLLVEDVRGFRFH